MIRAKGLYSRSCQPSHEVGEHSQSIESPTGQNPCRPAESTKVHMPEKVMAWIRFARRLVFR